MAASIPLQSGLQEYIEQIGKPFVFGRRKHFAPHFARTIFLSLIVFGATLLQPFVFPEQVRERLVRLDFDVRFLIWLIEERM